MAYTTNIVTVAEMQSMAGVNVGAIGASDADHITLQNYAEAYLGSLLKYKLDAVGWGKLDSTNQAIISEWAARFAGMTMIANDMSGYTTRIEAEDMINVNIFRMNQIEELLKKIDIQDFQGT